MTPTELNDYIKDFFVKNKTRSALMLKAPWGTGKSYYIQNDLIPDLKKNNIKSVVVSLYGKKDIYEVSKSIFLESKIKFLNKNIRGAAEGKIFGKTIIKNIAHFCNIDLDINKEDLQNIYESMDLSKTMVILEDLERSQVDILSIMGYVNNLVEQDKIKVLLVANEDEIIKYDKNNNKDNKEKENSEKHFTERTKEYLRIKEKTISDTLFFSPNICKSIDDIFSSFNNEKLNELLKDKESCDGYSLLSHKIKDNIMSNADIDNYNLRSLIFGCQKTIDLFEKNTICVDKSFLMQMLLGNIAFSLRRKIDETISWDSNNDISPNLGTFDYPLFKFSFNYICYQTFNIEEMNDFYTRYLRRESIKKEYTKVTNQLKIIYAYLENSEKDVKESLLTIKQFLKENILPIHEYGKLANYLISIKENIGCNNIIDECKKIMINNIGELDESTIDLIRTHDGIYLSSNTSKTEMNDFMEKMLNKIKISNKNLLPLDYSTKHVDDDYKYIYKNKDTFVSKRCFANKLDIEKLAKLLNQCSAKQIKKIRIAFRSVYSFSNIKDFFAMDKSSLTKLNNKIKHIIDHPNGQDKIQILQLKYLFKYLEQIINKL